MSGAVLGEILRTQKIALMQELWFWRRSASVPLPPHLWLWFTALVCQTIISQKYWSFEQKVIANDSPDAPREYKTYKFSWNVAMFHKKCRFFKNPYIGRIWVASKEKESLLAMIRWYTQKAPQQQFLPMAKCRSKYSHSFNHARDVHPDGCKAVQMFSTNLRESVFIREVFSKQTRKTRVSDT